MKKLVLIISLLILPLITLAQVTTEPLNPTDSEEITIFFDATGTELDGYTGDVYAFTGVTVNGLNWQNVIGGWGDNDNNPQLTRDLVNPNLYTLIITPTIFDYYGVSLLDNITELVFVFRSVDGALTTTQNGGDDIFIPIIPTNPPPVIVAGWGIVGSATPNGWGSTDDLPFYSTDIANVFVAYVTLTDGEIKFRENNAWRNNYGDDGTDGSLESNGTNIPVSAGIYKIVMDLNIFTYTIENYTWGLVGSDINIWGTNGDDIPLTYNATGKWSAAVTLNDGWLKIRQNNNWDPPTYGDNGPNGILDYPGTDIQVTAGFYLVTVDFDTFEYSILPIVNIPDPNFEQALIDLGIDGNIGEPINGFMLKSDAETITELYVSNKNINSLTGIEAFSSLEILHCIGNQLTVLDVSQNTALTNLECQSNQFTSLDVSNNLALKVLGCADNLLTEIDVTKNLELTGIWCTGNMITSLNLDLNTKLELYGLFNNPLTSLSIKNGNNSNIVYADMHSFTFDGTSSLSCITVDSESADNSNLNLDPNVTISNNCSGIVAIPDPIFEQALIDLEFDTDLTVNGEISQVDADKIYSLNINDKGVNDVSGIEYFVNLEQLFCNNNNLTKLQLNTHPSLNEIRINNNSLNTINVNNCPSLDILYCQYNQLQELDVTNNADLTVLECEGNGLEELNVTQNPILKVLGFGPNNISEIDVSQNLVLEAIWTNRNNLTTLNLDANSALRVIGLSGNPLTYVSLKNGNNEHVVYFEANGTDNLTCINADPVVSTSMSNSGKTFSEDCSTSIEGRWVIAPEAGALKVGPDPGSDLWWALNRFSDDIATRACYMDDEYVFSDDGSFDNVLGSETWLEEFQGAGVNGECGIPVAPHHGLTNASYVYDQFAGTITLNGKGAYLGLSKVTNEGYLSDPNDAPNSIIYDVLFSENRNIMTLSISLGSGFWTFKFVKEPVITLDAVTAIDCFGNNNGAINISVSGGATPVTFAWTKDGDLEFNSANEDLTDLTPGSYNVLFTDVYGLTASLDNVNIMEPSLLTSSIVNNSTGCSNIALVTAEGGTLDYNYLWSNGATSASIENVPVGTYDVTVTDANGCTTMASIDLTVGESFNPSASVTDVSCFGADDGVITVTNANGDAPFSFSKDGINFEGGEFPFSFNNLAAGTYEIAVRDANGCTGFISKTVSEPDKLLASLVTIESTCSGQSTGSITVEVTGGTGGLSYEWTETESGEYTSSQKSINGLAVGSYLLEVSDNNGCTATLEAVVPTLPEIVVDDIITDVSCRGELNGSIDLTVTGGTGDFAYSWTGNIIATSEDISGLSSGTNYNVTITDLGTGCTVSESYMIEQPDANLSLAASKTNASGCGLGLGTINAIANGGTAPYEYKLDDGSYQKSGDFSRLSGGNYIVWVNDFNGCVLSKEIIITDNGKDQWESNNGKKKAGEISSDGSITNGRIALGTDIADWFKFNTYAEGNYTVSLTHDSASFNVALYPDGKNVAALVPISTTATTKETTATTKEYALSGNATYFVEITGGLSYDCYNLSILPEGLASKGSNSKKVNTIVERSVNFWPNPSNAYFNIKVISSNSLERVDIQVFDVNSRLVHKGEFDPNEDYQFGQNLEGGIYIVNLKQASKLDVVRLVKY